MFKIGLSNLYNSYLNYYLNHRKRRFKSLFILSHMRAGSSLLANLLMSNKQILGFGESHFNYSSRQDFYSFATKVLRLNRKFWLHKNQYILDKVLQNQITDPAILFSPDVYVIFLIRHPYLTLPSLMKFKYIQSELKALSNYTGSLSRLIRYSRYTDKKRTIFIDYGDLISKFDTVAYSLHKFLGLENKITRSYKLNRFIGFRGTGDPGPNILTGKVIEGKYEIQWPQNISTEVVQKSVEVYEKCKSELSKFYCNTE